MKNYRGKNWEDFRREIIELDGHCCVRCHKSEHDGVILQVHHKEYIKEKLPWEYPYESCETLCKGCHAAEHGIIPPQFGWEYCGQDDLGDLVGECERCRTALRHLFYVFHAKWGMMEVGTHCCDVLTSTELATGFVRLRTRTERFLNSTRWKTVGNNKQIKQGGILVEIFNIADGYKLKMNGKEGKAVYKTMIQAKEKAFEVIEDGTAKEYLSKSKKGNLKG